MVNSGIKDTIIETICMNDLNEDMSMLAREYGLDFVKDLITKFGGIKFHVIKPNSCRRAVREAIKIKLEQGKGLKQIAVDLNLTENKIKKIIGI